MDKSNESRAVRMRRSRGSGTAVGRPRKLTPDAIVQSAIDIVDEHGADKLSIRSLAKRLEVQANAVYTHFDNLEAIEDAVIRKLLSEIPMPDASSPVPLREQLIDHFTALRAAHILHPRVAIGRAGSPGWISNARHLDSVLAQLAARGIDMGVAQLAHSALSGVTVVSALQANADRHETPAAGHRATLAALKTMKAEHVLQMMNLPHMKLPNEQRFRHLLGALIDCLLPASVAKGGKKAPGRS